MSASTIIMIVMICIGCATALAGLAVVAAQGIDLAKSVRRMSTGALPRLQVIDRKVAELTPRLEQMTLKQKELAERLEDLSASTAKLNYLWEELDAATGHIRKLKS